MKTIKSSKINLILISIVVLGTIGIFNYASAVIKIRPTRTLCTGTTACTSWDICINGIKTCNPEGYTLTPAGCNSGTVPAPTSTCPISESARTASGYAWSDNIGYISFSGSVAASTCIPVSPLTQTLACPAGETGSITQTRTSTCPGPVTSDWVTVSNTCATSCVPVSPLTQTLACPAGETGSITQTRTSTCPGPVTSDWVTTSNTCATPLTVPGAPTNVIAIAGNTQATVSFTAPASDGGSAITSYTVTSNPGGITATRSASPITITNLINNTAYNFTVKAINSIGIGTPALSNSVVPTLTWSPIMTMTWYAANSYCTNTTNGYSRLPDASELQYSMRNNLPNDWPVTIDRYWTNYLCTSGYFSSYPCPSSGYGGAVNGGAGQAWDQGPLNANLAIKFRCVK